jgi:hypothetical protein
MIDTKRLRCWIGALGMALPWIVLCLSLAFGYGWPDSISATYFSDPCITPFMIILGSAGILLFNYRGYNKLDDILNSSAGAFGLGICLFPCAATMLERIGTFQIPAEISDTIHMISAIGFFAILAYNSMFQFTKGSENPTPNKLKRNLIFRICGVGMIVSFLCIIPISIFNLWGGIWVVEAIALMFFGISWLTKANCYKWLFADK